MDGQKLTTANIHVKVYKQCWRREGEVAGGEVGEVVARKVKIRG